MDIRPVHIEDDHKSALHELSAYFDNEPVPGTRDGDRFEILLTLVDAYEAKHYPIDLSDPVGTIKSRVQEADLTSNRSRSSRATNISDPNGTDPNGTDPNGRI